ncbi:hypothetical protein EYF80_035714 [Liparis tanakae]|uniref:Uncharacterized protein n=1 Tax=Liparis tanakae TaxID=230148 RepID=A0A4Z2GMR8_9TELE|nr:hypothetical protein EYF80_035714 [Liparis tanakae]
MDAGCSDMRATNSWSTSWMFSSCPGKRKQSDERVKETEDGRMSCLRKRSMKALSEMISFWDGRGCEQKASAAFRASVVTRDHAPRAENTEV